MKTWNRKYEWVQMAMCVGSDAHTSEELTDDQLTEAVSICSLCRVRPECMEWAVREKACAVVVAGVLLPDPMFKSELRSAYQGLKRSIPAERQARGRDL